MRVADAYKTVIQPDIARVPVLEVIHFLERGGRTITTSHLISRNVLTEFDAKLSAHLAATRGRGFPAISITMRSTSNELGAGWQSFPSTHADSVPHALLAVAERTLEGCKSAELRIHQQDFGKHKDADSGLALTVTKEEIEVMKAAIEACRHFGEPEFVDVTGDFDMITAKPAGDEMRPTMIDLHNRTVSIPANGEVHECPLFNLRHHMGQSNDTRAYSSLARQALVAAKEDAVTTFRAAAEAQIAEFERVLAGREVTGHRLAALMALVTRLQTGLGEGLIGLSESARLLALDWSETVEANEEPEEPIVTVA